VSPTNSPGAKSGPPLAQQVRALRRQLRGRDPALLAARTGADLHQTETGSGELRLPLWGQMVTLPWPALMAKDAGTGEALPTFLQALLAYYLLTSDGTPMADRWIAFTELPDGQFYTRAFQGYSGAPLSRAFGNDLAVFDRVATSLGGARLGLGDAGFAFTVLPRVAVAAVAWRGDEDFPPSYQILFDAAAPHHLPTDGCAIVGSSLTRRLLAAHPTEEKVT
jgi:hypothetical protein